MIYLDYASTTPLDPRVKKTMDPFLGEKFGNPNSKYYDIAEDVKKSIKTARNSISDSLKIRDDELIFTSGATESNNFIIKGIAFNTKPEHMITTTIEHSSVSETMEYLESIGWDITYISPNDKGIISPNEIKESIKDNTKLVSVGWVNSEIGAIQEIKEISNICKAFDTPFHTDATQAISRIKFDLDDYENIQFMSFSSHKIYGPKGCGAAIIRRDSDGIPYKITPLIHGGEQEFGYRGGTLAVPNIIGFAKAFEILRNEFKQRTTQCKKLDNYFIQELKSNLGQHIKINNESFDRVPGIINVQFFGVNNQILLKNAKDFVAASTGSACSNSKPSKILKAIGKSKKEIQESIRFSLSHTTKIEDIQKFIKQIAS